MVLLEITIETNVFLASLVAFLFLLWIIINAIVNHNKKLLRERDGKLKELGLIAQRDTATWELKAREMTIPLLEQWKNTELIEKIKEIKETAEKEAAIMLSIWKMEETKKIRKESVNKSMGANFGKITEHLLPFSDYLKDFNPRDMRFIGSPVDLMIFEGITAKKDIINIHFVEIKTGSGQLSPKQRRIGNAIDNHRTYWKPIFVPKFDWKVAEEEDEDV